MKTLFVIGNGFDLWHGLATRYTDFCLFVDDRFQRFEGYFDFTYNDDNLWQNFEEELGTFYYKEFYDDNNHIDVTDDSFSLSHCHCLEDDLLEQVESIVEEISEAFLDWISLVEFDKVVPKITFSPKDKFLSFNYTKVLQQVYDLKNILHIHGSVDDVQIAFGHGEDIEEEDDFDEYGESTRTMFTDSENASKYLLYALKKQVADIIKQNHVFFDSLHEIDSIVVLGHSLNNIDIPYFQKLQESTGGCNWYLSCYNENDRKSINEAMGRVGLKPSQYHLDTIENLVELLERKPNRITG